MALPRKHVEAITVDIMFTVWGAHATRWLGLALPGYSWDFRNARSLSLFKGFYRCVRYIIRCWLWASCQLPPIQTPSAPQHPSANSQSWCWPEQSVPWPFSHIFIRAEITQSVQICRPLAAIRQFNRDSSCTCWIVLLLQGFCSLAGGTAVSTQKPPDSGTVLSHRSWDC